MAAKRIHAARSSIEAEFEKIRQRTKAEAKNTDMLSSYSENEMIALAGKWFRDIRAKQEKIRIKGAHGWKWSEQWERVRS